MTVLRAAGWIVFAAGVVLIVLGRSQGEIAYTKWGAVVGCAGMILTYGANLVRLQRRARTLPPSMRRSPGAADAPGPDGGVGDVPPGACR